MPHTPRPLSVHLPLAVAVSLACVPPVLAQQPEPNPPQTPAFMSRYDFHLAAEWLSGADERFTWDTHFGGDVDLVDYVVGRGKVLVDYEAQLGSEFRPFDPNQGNYVLEASASARVKGTELAGVFHHVSRHISDRPKRFAVAWNVLGVRGLRRIPLGRARLDVRAEAGKVVQHAFVDYAWTAAWDVRLDRPVRPTVGVYGRTAGELFGIDRLESTRSTQRGALVEAGVRLSGRGGSLELYGGYEQRVDADQVERLPVRWAFAGFRLVNW